MQDYEKLTTQPSIVGSYIQIYICVIGIFSGGEQQAAITTFRSNALVSCNRRTDSNKQQQFVNGDVTSRDM